MRTDDDNRKSGARRGQKKVHAPARTNDVTRSEVGEKSPNSGAQLRETPVS